MGDVTALYSIGRELREKVEKGGPDGLLKRLRVARRRHIEVSDSAELID